MIQEPPGEAIGSHLSHFQIEYNYGKKKLKEKESESAAIQTVRSIFDVSSEDLAAIEVGLEPSLRTG